MKILNPGPAEPGYVLRLKQCRSISVGFSGSALFVIQYVNLYQLPGSSYLIGQKLEVGVAS